MKRRLVLFTLGTDVHPFNRLVSWAEALVAADPSLDVLVQHGTTRPAAGTRNADMMSGQEFHEQLEAADLVVAQGGPGGIMEARSRGRLPIVVPRRSDLGEHVDDHQVFFARMLAERNLVLLAEDREAFLDSALSLLSSGGGRFLPHLGEESAFLVGFREAIAEPPERRGFLERLRLGGQSFRRMDPLAAEDLNPE